MHALTADDTGTPAVATRPGNVGRGCAAHRRLLEFCRRRPPAAPRNRPPGEAMQALDNLVILDLTHHIVGPYATKLFADYGADVIKIERPGGDIARRLGPFKGKQANP